MTREDLLCKNNMIMVDTSTKNKIRNIHQRINAVMEQVSYIQKDSNVMDRYRAVSHDKVIATIRPFIIKEGIVIEASQKVVEQPFHTVASVKPVYLFRAVYEVRFVNIDNPKDKIVIEVESHSLCTDDKAPGKTYSYAVKMAILKQFCLETGESDESPNSPPEPIPIVTAEQANELKKKAEMLGKEKKVLDAIKVQSFEQIPASKYNWAIENLNKQIAAAKESQ